MLRSRRHIYPLLILSAVTLVLLAGPLLLKDTQAAAHSAEQAVQQAWHRAQEAGSYAFTTELAQKTIPAPALANVGSGSRTETLTMEGQTDLPGQTMQLRLWPAGSPDLGPDNAIEVRIAGDRAYGRVAGGAWQEVEDFTGGFAPAGDLLAYLAAGKNYQEIGPETRTLPDGSQVTFTRYTFEIDGPALARYIRDQLERTLHERGELPAGLTLDVSREYNGLVGSGEVWVDSAGLPLRLLVQAVYPEQSNGEQVEAHIQTDFFFDPPGAAGAPAQPWDLGAALSLRDAAADWQLTAFQVALVLAMAGLLLLASCYHRRRIIQTGVVLFLLFCMLFLPTMQAGQVGAYLDRQADRQAQLNEHREVAESQANYQRSQLTSTWDPQVNAAAQLEARQATSSLPANSNPPGISSQLAIVSWRAALDEEVPDPTGNPDGDGLTNIQEARLGTNPEKADTDDDGLRDALEVQGFDLGGRHWYLDPTSPDTNNDGLLDTQECWSTLPATLPSGKPCTLDTDGDGQPDLFDRDNDGDGIDDRVDLSPFSKASFGKDELGGTFFELQVNGIHRDAQGDTVPVFVDLQLRPVDPQHLTYALNVLDWPSGDMDGQVQRVLDTTFATSPLVGMTPADVRADPSSENGDIRLIPMVEILVPYKDGHTRNLPVKEDWTGTVTRTTPLELWLDTARLAPYGITARYTDDLGTLAIYLPVHLIYDELGAARVAFGARMLYWPEDPLDWGNAHQVRLVWTLQMLGDTCTNVPPTPAGVEPDVWLQTYCAQAQYRQEALQILHVYPEEWVLAGFSVREDQGMDVAIAFEDPDHDNNLDLDNHLWALVNGLDQTFIAARDANSDSKRDITIAEIRRRFDNQSNGGTTKNERWRLPIDAMRVVTYSLAHQDLIAAIPMTYTRQVLEDHFVQGGQPLADHPSLLFVREERGRTANLDTSGQAVQRQTDGLTVDLSAVSLDTLAAMNWQPYRYGDGDWEPYPLDQYWDQLSLHLEDVFPPDPDDPEGQLVAQGKIIVAQAFYMTMVQGTAVVVQSDSTIYTNLTGALPDRDIAQETGAAQGQGAVPVVSRALTAISKLITGIVTYSPHMQASAGVVAIARAIALSLYVRSSWSARNAWANMTGWEQVSVSLTVIKAVLSVGRLVLAASSDVNLKPLDAVINALSVVQKVVDLVNTVHHIRAVTQGVSGLMNKFAAVGNSITRASVVVGVVGLVIAALMTIGAFVAEMTMSHTRFGSLEFNAAFAHMLATIIVSVLMLVISFIPIVGQIIAAVVAVIDGIVALVCGVLPENVQQGEAAIWACKGISGLVAEGIAQLIYTSIPMVNLEDAERLQLSAPLPSLGQPRAGFADGNAFALALRVTNTIDFPSASDRAGAYRNALTAWAYSWEFTDEALRSATFAYALAPYTQTLHEDMARGTMSSQWTSVDEGGERPYYNVWDVATDGSSVPLDQAGINVAVPVYLAEGFAIPVQECWSGGGLLAVCYRNTMQNTSNMDLGQSLRWDVLPADLSGFYSLVAKDGGYALAWGQSGEVTFPRLKDADGDGLRGQADGGSDPNDSMWDTDADGLSDFYEVQNGLDPQAYDIDHDGLSDRQELLQGTNPRRADSDGDGLTDAEELAGWDFAYDIAGDGTPRITHVTSDPLAIDVDQDTLSDYRERLFNFHPGVPSDPNVLAFSSEVQEYVSSIYTPTDGYVLPGATLRYSATLENKLLLDYAQGLLSTDFPAVTITGQIAPLTFVLPPTVKETLAGNLGVAAGAASGAVELTQVAGAEITDPRAAANYADLLLHFEEPTTATVFQDSSGAYPPNNGRCTPPACPQRQAEGYAGKGLHFDGVDDRVQADVMEGASASLWFKTTQEDGALLSYADSRTAIYLDEGGLCGRIEVEQMREGGPITLDYPTCSWATYNDDRWHHVVFSWDGIHQELYVDGVQRVRSYQFATYAQTQRDPTVLNLGLLADDYSPWPFTGSLDEVAIYDRFLDADEVRQMYENPVFLMRFDEPSLVREGDQGIFADSSGFGITGRCTAAGTDRLDCPTPGQSSYTGRSAMFYGNDRVLADPSNALALKGNYTQAFWIKPMNRQNLPYHNSFRQGILGDGLDNFAYPYVLRKGTSLVVGFGTGTQRVERTFSNVLPTGIWSYVVVTYETFDEDDNGSDDHGRFSLYVNGLPRGEQVIDGALTLSQEPHLLNVGLVTTCGNFYYRGLYSLDDTNELYSDEFLVEDWATDSFMKWSVYHGDVDKDEFHAADKSDAYCTAARAHRIRVWEDDSGSGHNNDVDMGYFDVDHTLISWEDSGQNRSSAMGWVMQFVGGGGWVALKTKNANPSIPFYGGLDEVALYNRALSSYDVEELYRSQTRSLYLPMDDPPGTYRVANATGQEPATCPSNLATCPTSGVAGRIGQAGLFQAAQTDHLSTQVKVEQSSSSVPGATFMAWVYPTSTSSGRHQVITSDNYGYDWSLLREGGTWHVFNGAGSRNTGATVDLNRWQHIAAVFDPANYRVRFYKDGVQVGSDMGIAFDSSVGNLTIGSHATAGQYFDGRIDEVQVYNQPLNATAIQTAYNQAPQLMLHLDEAVGADTFADDSGNGHDGTCSQVSSCSIITFTQLFCIAQDEGWGEDRDGEFYFQLNGEQIWYGDNVYAGQTRPINQSVNVCPGSQLHMWEDDRWSADDDLGQFAVTVAPGNYNHVFADGSNAVRLNWQVGSNQFTVGDCPTAGTKGQVGLSPEFRSGNDAILTSMDIDQSSSSPGVTMMAWVLPTSASPGRHQVISSDDGAYDWSLLRKGATWHVYTGAGSRSTGAEVQVGYWQHVAAVFDPTHSQTRFYLNGVLVTDTLDIDYAGLDHDIALGFNPGSNDQFFDGRIDEVQVYQRPLATSEIETIFRYQGQWVEERQTHQLTVDDDAPTSILASDTPYRANHDVYLHIATQDPTSPVTGAEWRVNGGAWTPAPACMDVVAGTAYCPLFDPTGMGGEGAYTLQTRATDRVGYVEVPTQTYTLYVDDTAPTVGTDIPDGTFLAPQPHPTQPNAWIVSLHGTANDPSIGAVPGSGVQEVWVTLLDSSGVAARGGRQPANLQGSDWTLDYRIEGGEPIGAYTVQVEAVDAVGNGASTDLIAILLDATAPHARAIGPVQGGALLELPLDEAAGATTFADASGNGNSATCSGAACPTAGQAGRYGQAAQFDGVDDSLALASPLDFARGDYALAAWFHTSQYREQTIVAATTADGGRARLYVRSDGLLAFEHSPTAPGTEAVSGHAYSTGDWHHAAAIRQGPTLYLYVDGEIVGRADASGAFAEALAVTVGHLPGQSGDYFGGTLDEVYLYPFALTTGAIRGLTAYGPEQGRFSGTLAEPPASPATLLEMRLEEPDGEVIFADASDYDNWGSCGGSFCPQRVDGAFGQARQFDGVDDRICILHNSTLEPLTGSITVMAWVHPDTLSGVQRIVSAARTASADGFGLATNGSGLRLTAFGVRNYDTVSVTLRVGEWQHIAAVLQDGDVTFYVDGVARETITGTTAILPNTDDALCLGATTLVGSGTPTQLFAGTLDEVRLAGTALSPAEIRLLAQERLAGVSALDLEFSPSSLQGSPFYNEPLPAGTVLYLPLDASSGSPSGGGETRFADLSSNALVATCSGASCPGTGALGHTGRAVRFNGQNDSLTVPEHPTLNLATDLTLAAWVRRNPAGYWDVIYDSGSGANNWWVSISPSGWLFFEVGLSRYRSTVTVPGNSWHHVAAVKSGSSLTLYLDAVPAGSHTVGFVPVPSGPKTIGGVTIGSSFYAFQGLIDELVLLNRALSPDEVRSLYLGAGPILHLPLDQTWLDSGGTLQDTSGWEQPVLLHGAAGQHVTAGQVGSGALALNGTSDYATVERSLELARGDYALAAWFRTDAATRQTILVAGDPTGDLPGLLVEILADGRVRYLHRSPPGGSGGTAIISPLAYNDGFWHLAVAVKQSNSLQLYVDGAAVGSATDATSLDLALNVTIGRFGRATALRYMDGDLDDIQLYPRALNALEVQALYDRRWRSVPLDESGPDVVRTTWAYTVPAGLEGSYTVDLRGWDDFDNGSRSLDERTVWSGALDTLAPRLELKQTIYRVGSTYAVRYIYSANDLNLTESDFHAPCTPAPTRTYFAAPWYRSLVGSDSARLYTLSGSCRMYSVGRSGHLAGPGTMDDIMVQDDLAYMIGHYTNTGTLRIVDVTRPWKPRQVGQDTVMPNGSVAIFVAAGDPPGSTYAYVAEDELGTMGIVDVSDPAAPQQVGVYDAPGNLIHGLSVAGGDPPGHTYAYVANADWGLRVVDVTNPVSPTEVGAYLGAGYPQGVSVQGIYAYVADGLAGLTILDVSSPTNPLEIGNCDTPDWANGVHISGTMAYVADGDSGLRLIDITNPANPYEVGSYDTPSWAMDVHVAGPYAYVSDGDSGVWVLNVANPASPRPVGRYNTPGTALGIDAGGAYAYVADGAGGLRVLVNRLYGDELAACDLSGNCARIQPLEHGLQSLDAEVPLTGTLIVEPVSGTYLTSTAVITAAGGAYSPSFLRALTVTVDGGPIYTQTWSGPTVSDTAWLAPWTPAGDGAHHLAALLLDWSGMRYSDTITVTLDTDPPTIALSSTVVTSTHASAGQVRLHGTVSDNVGTGSVAIQVDGGAWWSANIIADTWTALWVPDSAAPPDGDTYTITAKATDLAGWTTSVTETVLMDIAGPAPVTMTLAYQDQGGFTHPITRAGTTIYAFTPTLVFSWTASSDGSGLSGYRAGWTAVDLTGVTETLVAYAPGDPRRNTYLPGEAQKVAAAVYSLDTYSNTAPQHWGPVYVDSPLTPDYAPLVDPEGVPRGWMDGGCTLLGVDRKVARGTGSRPSLDAEQRFYATWDAAGLRLAWTGADWSVDGDLFVYLDTAPGGITVTLNPYTATVTNTVVYLPGNTPGMAGTTPMAADYLLWVQDTATAALWQWDGSAWITSTVLTETSYLFNPGWHGGQTDLYVPFALLGIADPAATSLDMVALASEEDALHLWAAMPPANPVNSNRVAIGAERAAITTFALTQRYHWDALGPGLCPNGSLGAGVAPIPDSDLDLALTVAPAGTTYAFLGDHLFALWDVLFGGQAADASSFFGGRDTDYPPLADMAEITYTVRYENLGTAPATGVALQVRSDYALVLPDGTPLPPPEHGYSLTVPIGTVGPGTAGSVNFRGRVDLSWAQGAYSDCLPLYPVTPEVCEVYLRWAVASVEVVDDAHPAGTPLEWLWADHLVDYLPPAFYGLVQPGYVLAAVTNTLSGYAFEDAGIPLLTAEVQGPAGGTTLACPDDTPADGTWSCTFDATAANGGVPPQDGDPFQARLQATDGTGQVGPWTAWQPLIVDTVPPTVTAVFTVTRTLTGTVSLLWYRLQGQVVDNHGAAGVEVCLQDACRPANTALEPAAAHSYEDWPDPVLPIDASTACGSGAIVRTFSVTDTFAVGTVQFGLNAEHPDRDQIRAELTSPSGTTVRLLGDDLLAGTRFQDVDALLYDAAGEGLHAYQGDDDPLGPFFDREARPQAPLYAFRGEGAAGTWTLTICDTDAAHDDGLYHLSHLVLTPLDTAPRTGPWWYTQSFSETADGVSQTLSIYGLDLVGNRSDPPLEFSFVLDNVPPALTVTAALPQLRFMDTASPVPVLTGTVRDGGGVERMYAIAQDPTGTLSRERVDWIDENWSFRYQPAAPGLHLIWITAEDRAGNGTRVGPFLLNVTGPTTIFLPLVANQRASSPYQIGLPLVTRTVPAPPDEPIAGLAADSSSPTVLGQATAFTATLATGTNVSYTWALGDNSWVRGPFAFTHTYTMTGAYTAVVTASNSVSVATATVVVQVLPAEEPVAGLVLVSDSPTLLGDATTFTATVTAGSNVVYEWDFGDGTKSFTLTRSLEGVRAVYHMYPAAGVYTTWVTASNSVSLLTATTTVTVTEGIVAGLAVAHDGPTALGQATTFTATVTAGRGVHYAWAFGDGATSQGASVTHVYAAAGSYSAVVTASNSLSWRADRTAVEVVPLRHAIYLPLVIK